MRDSATGAITRLAVMLRIAITLCRHPGLEPGSTPPPHEPIVSYWTSILCNKPHGTLYVGMTNDIIARTYQHREGFIAGFTKRYGIKRLVHFEEFSTPGDAICSARRHSSAGRAPGRLRLDRTRESRSGTILSRRAMRAGL